MLRAGFLIKMTLNDFPNTEFIIKNMCQHKKSFKLLPAK